MRKRGGSATSISSSISTRGNTSASSPSAPMLTGTMLTPILQVKESAPPYGEVETSVVDPNPDADPYSTYHPHADPDSDFYLMRIRMRIRIRLCHHADPDLDPDPSYQLKAQTLEKVLK
jgi:hypothetical protein